MNQKHTFNELVGVCTALIFGLTISLFAVQASDGTLPTTHGGLFSPAAASGRVVQADVKSQISAQTLIERKQRIELRLKRKAAAEQQAKEKSTNGIMVKGVSIGTATSNNGEFLHLNTNSSANEPTPLPEPTPIATSTTTSTPRFGEHHEMERHDVMAKKNDRVTGLARATQAKEDQIKKLQERIKQLEIKLSDREQQVNDREKKVESKIDEKLTARLKGKILLQTEQNGEAWYIDPVTGQKFYLSDGNSAYQALKAFGLGATDNTIDSIPMGTTATGTATSTPSIPTVPKKPITPGHLKPLEGKILLQVQQHGEAWYIHDGKRFYLKDGSHAYEIMRKLALGIKNTDLHAIPTGTLSTDSTTSNSTNSTP